MVLRGAALDSTLESRSPRTDWIELGAIPSYSGVPDAAFTATVLDGGRTMVRGG